MNARRAKPKAAEPLWTWVKLDFRSDAKFVPTESSAVGMTRDEAHLVVSRLLSEELGPDHEKAVEWRAGVEDDISYAGLLCHAIFPYEGDLAQAIIDWHKDFIEQMNQHGSAIFDLSEPVRDLGVITRQIKDAEAEHKRLVREQDGIIWQIVFCGGSKEWLAENFNLDPEYIESIMRTYGFVDSKDP